MVEVLAEGFRYEGRPYASLSAIAVAVTGTRWNGLAFFGLTAAPARAKRKERVDAIKSTRRKRGRPADCAARSTPGNRPKRDWSRTSTRSMRSGRRPRHSSRVSAARAGSRCPTRYDDGGFTGANMERPALQRLLGSGRRGRGGLRGGVQGGSSEPLAARLHPHLSQFEKRNVSFVAVTQQFNTSTSLGRLTLNILLSFAQFERELIGERTRDKMSAARKKGKWVGGCPVLGYDVDPGGGRLIVNEEEARTGAGHLHVVRGDRIGAANAGGDRAAGLAAEELDAEAGRVPRQEGRLTLNSLRRLLTNILYTGAVRHKGQTYPGEHAAILAARTVGTSAGSDRAP